MLNSGKRAPQGCNASRTWDRFPRFTEDFVSPPFKEVVKPPPFENFLADFCTPEDSPVAGAPFMESPAVWSKNTKGGVKLTKARAASKVFSLSESEGETDSVSCVSGGNASFRASRNQSEVEQQFYGTPTDESVFGGTEGSRPRVFSYDRSNYMESPRQLSEELPSPGFVQAPAIKVFPWTKEKKSHRAPLVNFSRCAFSCASGSAKIFRAMETLPRQAECPESQVKYDEESASIRRSSSQNSSGSRGLKRSLHWLYSRLKAANFTAEPTKSNRKGVETVRDVLDEEWKKLAQEQSERMSSMLDILRSIASKLEGIAPNDIQQEAAHRHQLSGRSLSSYMDDSSKQSTPDRQAELGFLSSEKHSRSSRNRVRLSGPTLQSLDTCTKFARVVLRGFAEALTKEMNEGSGRNLILGELLPRVQFVKPWHLKYGVEAFVCEVFFADFEKEGFGMLDVVPHETFQTPEDYWLQYEQLAYMQPRRATDTLNPDHDLIFHLFCQVKLHVFLKKVHWIRWSDELLDAFLISAKHVWRLHTLSFAFSSPAQIIFAAQSQVFNSEEMEPVDDADGLIMDAKAFSSKTELTVMPGFRLPEGTVKCKVYFKPKKVDKRLS